MSETNSNPQQNSTPYQGGNKSVMMIYNEGTAMGKFGYWSNKYYNNFAYIEICPAYATPVDNKKFNIEKGITFFFSLSLDDIKDLKTGIKNLLTKEANGEIGNFSIRHYGDKTRTQLVFGNDIDGYDYYIRLSEFNENSEITKEYYLNLNKLTEETTNLFEDVDIDSLTGGTPVLYNKDFQKFVSFINSSEKVINGESQYQPAILNGNQQSSSRTSPIVTPGQRPRERKISPSSSIKKPSEINSAEDAKALFDD